MGKKLTVGEVLKLDEKMSDFNTEIRDIYDTLTTLNLSFLSVSDTIRPVCDVLHDRVKKLGDYYDLKELHGSVKVRKILDEYDKDR